MLWLTPTWAIWRNGITPKLGQGAESVQYLWNGARRRTDQGYYVGEIGSRIIVCFWLVPKWMSLGDLEQLMRLLYRKRVCDFLLVGRCDYSPILHRFWDLTAFWQRVSIACYAERRLSWGRLGAETPAEVQGQSSRWGSGGFAPWSRRGFCV